MCVCIFYLKDGETPYLFYVDEHEITDTLEKALERDSEKAEETERVVDILYQPQATFNVQSVTRCSSTLGGHADAVVSAQFSPDGRYVRKYNSLYEP